MIRVSGVGQCIPVALADQECRFRKRIHLPNVVAVIVADADKLDVLGLELQLAQKVHEADFRRNVGRVHGMTGVPHHVVIAVLDQVAAVDDLELQAVEVIGVRKAQAGARTRADIPRRRGAAFEARERHLRRRRGRPLREGRDGRQRICADADRQHG
jgi:hypothetical protein